MLRLAPLLDRSRHDLFLCLSVSVVRVSHPNPATALRLLLSNREFAYRSRHREQTRGTGLHHSRNSNGDTANSLTGQGMQKLGEFDHPSLPEGHSLRRHVVYEIAAPSRPSTET